MNEILVAQGYTTGELELAEQYVPSGGNAEVRIFFDYDLSPDEVMDIESGLFDQGVELTGPVTYGSRMLVIPFKKSESEGIGLVFLPLIAIAGIVGAGGIFGWQLFSDGAGEAMDKLTKIVIVGTGVTIAIVAIWFVTKD